MLLKKTSPNSFLYQQNHYYESTITKTKTAFSHLTIMRAHAHIILSVQQEQHLLIIFY